jgi:pyridoxine kinase
MHVLSIQSHVVHGYVGNRSATFPLQVLGFEVDQINSVQFSNHTGYGSVKGQILDAIQLGELYDGLRNNNLLNYTHLLTGYIGSESFLLKVKDVISDLKAANANLTYVCDPVMGDDGRMYVPEALLPIYKEHIIPLADLITPNQYEAELLSGIRITDIPSARRAMDALHDLGAGTVIISSSVLGGPDNLIALASSRKNCGHAFEMRIPRLPATFTGTGDLLASLLLAWTSTHSCDLSLACEKSMSTLQHVLKRTILHARELAGPDKLPNKSQLELRLVQSKHDIENPELCIKAHPINS